LWKLEASTLYDRVLRGLETEFKVVIVTFDAALPGVGVVLREGRAIKWVRGRRYEGLTTVLTFPRHIREMGQLEHQAWREAWGAALAVEMALMDDQVRNCVMVLVNDCVPVLSAIEKGSSRSVRLQSAAEAIHKACIPRGVRVMPLHVAGKQLIVEQVDYGSRRHAQALRGPACSARLRGIVAAFVAQVGCSLTIDYFASADNTMCERFAAWTDEPGAELVDAFTARNWDVRKCGCGREHREWGFFFAPSGLEDRVVRRARSDGARGIFLVPRNRKLAYYQSLRQNAILKQDLEADPDLFEHVRKPMTKHSLFAVDFARQPDRSAPYCGQEARLRRRGREAEPVEAEEARALVRQISLLEEEVRRS